jgi:PIN domain nuclease of toxin-antitoxin system
MADVVLDASAILARAFGEPGGERVGAVMVGAFVSAVNLAEVVQKLLERGLTEAATQAFVRDFPCEIEPLEADSAVRLGGLRRKAQAAGLSLADRACLELAIRKALPAMTADRAWADLDLGVEVVLIR